MRAVPLLAVLALQPAYGLDTYTVPAATAGREVSSDGLLKPANRTTAAFQAGSRDRKFTYARTEEVHRPGSPAGPVNETAGADVSPAPVGTAPGPAMTIDFNRAVSMALSTSPAMRASRGRLRSADGAIMAAEGARWPRLSVGLDASGSDDPLAVFGYKLRQRRVSFGDFGAGQFTGPASLDIAPHALNYPGAYGNFDTHLQIEWPVYTGGRSSAEIAAARAAAKAAQSGDAAAREAVIFEVLRAYEGVRAAEARLTMARRSEKASSSYLSAAKKRYREGTSIKSDVLTAQVSLEQNRLIRRTAHNQLQTAREYLRILVDLPEQTDIRIGAPAEPRMPTASLVSLQSEAVRANPTLRALRSRARARQAALDGEKAAYRPSISLMVRHDWNDRRLGLSSPSYTVAGVLSWDLFDFGTRRGAVEKASGELDTAQAQVSEFVQKLQVEVDRAWRTAREAAEQVSVSATAVEQAREAQRILKLRYGQGLATITELLDGQARLEQAEGNLVGARYDLRVSRGALLATLGQLDLGHIRTSGTDEADTAPATGDSSLTGEIP